MEDGTTLKPGTGNATLRAPAMMNTTIRITLNCENCKWWDGDCRVYDRSEHDRFPDFAVCLYVLSPDNEREKLGGIHDEFPHKGTKAERKQWWEKFVAVKREIRVNALDASDYTALVRTRKDHYCSAWENEE